LLRQPEQSGGTKEKLVAAPKDFRRLAGSTVARAEDSRLTGPTAWQPPRTSIDTLEKHILGALPKHAYAELAKMFFPTDYGEKVISSELAHLAGKAA
jgi:hypothetical protein